ncbi:hypothetical protein AL387_gp075 [Carp edema virus]|nr:hypothetical protein AL387_gp075 [Carp edema virus]
MTLFEPHSIFKINSVLIKDEIKNYAALYKEIRRANIRFDIRKMGDYKATRKLGGASYASTNSGNKISSYDTAQGNQFKIKAVFSFGINYMIKHLKPELKFTDFTTGYNVTTNLLKQFKCAIDFYKTINNTELELTDFKEQIKLDLYMSLLPKEKYLTWLFLRMFPSFNLIFLDGYLHNIGFEKIGLIHHQSNFLVGNNMPTQDQEKHIDKYYKEFYWTFYNMEIGNSYYEIADIFYTFANRANNPNLHLDTFYLLDIFRLYKTAVALKFPPDFWNLLIYNDILMRRPLYDKKMELRERNSDILNYCLDVFNQK